MGERDNRTENRGFRPAPGDKSGSKARRGSKARHRHLDEHGNQTGDGL